ncbi:MAG: NAD+ synthase [Phycisphaerae bacterium]|nr:NAD+ synthase [Phycisphaerae bacterium]
MRVTLLQTNPTVGAIDANAARIAEGIRQAAKDRSDLVITGELATLGYPPRDLIEREGVAARSQAAVERLAAECLDVAALIGFAEPWPSGPRPFRNAVAFCRNGRVEAVYAKRLLPTYDVFSEDRHFTPGTAPLVVDLKGERVAVLVCEDLWRAGDANAARGYREAPLVDSLLRGATVAAVLSASPFVAGKDAKHADALRAIAEKGTAVISVNQVGGNDDLVFDGRSRAFGRHGLVARLPGFREAVETVDLDAPPIEDVVDRRERETIDALVLGIRDYLRKTGHTKALLGLSGGIDSAIVAALATLAIGGANVTGVLLPSRYSSQGSIDDARESARRLRLGAAPLIPIEAAHAALASSVAGVTRVEGVVDENIQSRIRGTILMALSNASGAIVLTTGNKSEYAAGYATLYGDMNGGLAPIGDILKTNVYALSRYMNEHFAELGFAEAPIPVASIEKAPSAELRPDQTDQDTLPPYEALDAIVEGWIDRQESVDTIATRTGLDRALVARWCRAIDRTQYKRDQAAIILKMSPRAFGRGRPMPVAGE